MSQKQQNISRRHEPYWYYTSDWYLVRLMYTQHSRVRSWTTVLKLKGRWNDTRPLLREKRSRAKTSTQIKRLHRCIPTRHQTKIISRIMTKQARELLLLHTNQRRRKQGKRQRGGSQEQLETRRKLKHDPLCIPICSILQ